MIDRKESMLTLEYSSWKSLSRDIDAGEVYAEQYPIIIDTHDTAIAVISCNRNKK